MKALVTGGTGFVGSHVVRRLVEEGHSVRVLSRRREIPQKLKLGDVEIFAGDLEDVSSVIKAMKGTEVFYHIGEIKNTNRAASEKNVELTERITENLRSMGVRRFVFISSLTVAGIPSAIPADEATKPAVVLTDHYTAYKRRCEELITGRLEGPEYAIIRPAPVYGPGSRYLGRLIDLIEKVGPFGIPFAGSAKNTAPLVFVKDLASAVYLAGIRPAAAGRVFNLTDGLRHSWHDFLRAIAGLLGKKLRIISIPTLLLKVPAMPLDLFTGLFGIDLDAMAYLDYFSKDLYFDNARARELLKWKPEYDLSAGVKEMVEYYRMM